ncbi:substrate-binding domain-containing protein [Thioclava sp. GXIMD2076]|uniref:substrate-binding domain-containing protein n=1 Tax=Thioclava sp. GXIMD2076 TaxID=3131931 RepID=UPI0030CD5424
MFARLLFPVLLCVASPLAAATYGVTLIDRSQIFIKALEGGFTDAAASMPDTDLEIMDAQNSTETQLEQVQKLIDMKVDALIVNAVSADSGLTISRMAQKARIPLVFVNAKPLNWEVLQGPQVYVGSPETQSGSLEVGYICDALGNTGTVSILVGDLVSEAARERTKAYYSELATDHCSGVTIQAEAFGNWSVDGGRAIMEKWLAEGPLPDAVVANNDDMALGAIAALDEAGIDHSTILIGGIDGTATARKAMAEGKLDVTVLQNAAEQARGAIVSAQQLLAGETLPPQVWIPFELVKPADASVAMN